MPELLHMVARLPSETGLPQDVTEMTLNVWSLGPFGAGDVADHLALFRDFFNVPSGAAGTDDVANFISDSVSRASNACAILGYVTDDLTGATPFGSPAGMVNFTMGPAASANTLPNEVAAVLSYNADLTDVPISEINPSPPPATIRPAQRRRGRLFVGPLQDVADFATGTQSRPSSTFRNSVCESFKVLAEAVPTVAIDDRLVVWSKLDAEGWEVTAAYMDDAWDTQRRRGVEATTRTSVVISI